MMHPVSPPLLHLGKNDIDRCVPSSFTLTLRISACFAFKNVSDGLVCMGRSGTIPRPSRWYLQMRTNISLVFHSCRLRNPTARYMLSALFSWRKHLLRMDWTLEWEKDAPENTLRFLYGNWHCFHHSSDALLWKRSPQCDHWRRKQINTTSRHLCNDPNDSTPARSANKKKTSESWVRTTNASTCVQGVKDRWSLLQNELAPSYDKEERLLLVERVINQRQFVIWS